MDRFARDLLFFKRELENERDQMRRRLLEQQIAKVEMAILAQLQQERESLRQQTERLEAFTKSIKKKWQVLSFCLVKDVLRYDKSSYFWNFDFISDLLSIVAHEKLNKTFKMSNAF